MKPAVKHLPEVFRRLVSLTSLRERRKGFPREEETPGRYTSLCAALKENLFPPLCCLQCPETLISKLGHPGERVKVSADA